MTKPLVLALHALPDTLRTLFAGQHTRSEVCRAATLACALTNARGSLPPSGTRGEVWTTVSFDAPSALLFEHVAKARGYRNLTVLMAQVTYAPELVQMTLGILAMSPAERQSLLRETMVSLGLPVPPIKPTKPKAAAPPVPVKKLRSVEIALLKLLDCGDRILSAQAKEVLESERAAVRQRLNTLSALPS